MNSTGRCAKGKEERSTRHSPVVEASEGKELSSSAPGSLPCC